MSVEGVGNYLNTTVGLASVERARVTFNLRGGGHMIALFAAQPSIWFRVGQVQRSLRLQGVMVSATLVRTGLNQLVEMDFLEKMVDLKKGSTAPHRYRRRLNAAQRALLAESVKVSEPTAVAIREKRARLKARDAAR